jgi:NADPH-dependent 2,4-dienoyl-CoA reductase/sulfur reductase-like enzyme/nitrite reductase/ring-hydroxylating ferredoxin subunit
MSQHQVGPADSLLQDGQMQRIELEGKPVVLARVGGEYYAFGGKCTHYGAPLNEGVLKEHMLICPWHHACFDIRSGLRLEPPAMNDLPHYPLQILNGMVTVTLPNDNQTAPQRSAGPADGRTFVIVGGGAAGNAAAEQLLREGFTGKIVILSADPVVPVDRPNLSKDYLDGHAKPEWIPLRDQDWYTARGIDVRLNARVKSISPDAHTITMESGETVRYDRLLLATGGTPRHLTNVPGVDLGGIYVLRTLADADRIIAAAQSGQRAVIIGASFIGMEVAASLAGGRGVAVTVVAPEAVPFATILGEEIGRMFQQVHEQNKVRFCLGDGVTGFSGENGQVRQVELKSGEKLDADFVVVGIGVAPATDFLRGSGLPLNERDHSVLVNANLQTSHPDIFAAGDIARWDNGSEGGTRIEHWRLAQQHGIVAAKNLLGGSEDINAHVPFFWTTQWKVTLNYVGHATKWDEIIFRGKPADQKFIAFYISGGKLLAAAGCGYDTELDAIEIILRDRMPLSPGQMRDQSFDLITYARSRA